MDKELREKIAYLLFTKFCDLPQDRENWEQLRREHLGAGFLEHADRILALIKEAGKAKVLRLLTKEGRLIFEANRQASTFKKALPDEKLRGEIITLIESHVNSTNWAPELADQLLALFSARKALAIDEAVKKFADWVDKTFTDDITKAQMLATNTWQRRLASPE